MFKFQRLIEKYSTTFTVEYADDVEQKSLTPDDFDDLGRYKGDLEQKPLQTERGAIIPLPARVIYQSGGRLTEQDRTLYSLNHDIPLKSKIRHNGMVYSVESKIPYSEIADFAQYTLRAVTAFD